MDKELGARIFKEHANSVYRYALSRSLNREVAEDVTAESFKRMLEQKESFQEDLAQFWLIRVARNLIFDKSRKGKKSSDITPQIINEVVEKHPSLESEVTSQILIKKVKSKLLLLGDSEREVIILRVWEEMKFTEISELVKMKEVTVKQKYYRSLEKLKKLIQEDDNKSIALVSDSILLQSLLVVSNGSLFTAPSALFKSLEGKLFDKSKLWQSKKLVHTVAAIILTASTVGIIVSPYVGLNTSVANINAEACADLKELAGNGDLSPSKQFASELIEENVYIIPELSALNSEIDIVSVTTTEKRSYVATRDILGYLEENPLTEKDILVVDGKVYNGEMVLLSNCIT